MPAVEGSRLTVLPASRSSRPARALFAAALAGTALRWAMPASATSVTLSGAMEGNIAVNPGDTVRAGYAIAMPGAHPAAQVTISSAGAAVQVTCSGGKTQWINIGLPGQTFAIAARDASWQPSADPAAAWQGPTPPPHGHSCRASGRPPRRGPAPRPPTPGVARGGRRDHNAVGQSEPLRHRRRRAGRAADVDHRPAARHRRRQRRRHRTVDGRRPVDGGRRRHRGPAGTLALATPSPAPLTQLLSATLGVPWLTLRAAVSPAVRCRPTWPAPASRRATGTALTVPCACGAAPGRTSTPRPPPA